MLKFLKWIKKAKYNHLESFFFRLQNFTPKNLPINTTQQQCMRCSFPSTLTPQHTFLFLLKNWMCEALAEQLVRALSHYTKVGSLIPSQGTYRSNQ